MKKLIQYLWFRMNMRTNVMPLGYGTVAVTTGVIDRLPVVVMVPLRNRQASTPGADAPADLFDGVKSIADLPRGSSVVSFTPDALPRFAETVTELHEAATEPRDEDGYYWFTSERSSTRAIAQLIRGQWHLIGEAEPVTLDELNSRGWDKGVRILMQDRGA